MIQLKYIRLLGILIQLSLISSTAHSADKTIYITTTPSSVAKWIYITDSCLEADIEVIDKPTSNAEWIYITDTPSSVAEWIYITNTASSVAEWIYISNSPENADFIICIQEPALRTKEIIVAVMYGLLFEK